MGKMIIQKIAVVKAQFTAKCAEEGCNQIIEKGQLCHARRPAEQYICSSCAAKMGWAPLKTSTFVDPLKASIKASKQAGKGVKKTQK